MPLTIPAVTEFITSAIQRYGVYGLGVGMFCESLGIPYSSMVLIITAGTLIASGKTTFGEAILISTLGLVLGSAVSYAIGYFGKKTGQILIKRCNRSDGESPNLARLDNFIRRYGGLSVFLSQFFGFTRTFVSIPAGAMEMNVFQFLFFTALGGIIFCALAIGLSMALTELFRSLFGALELYFLLLFPGVTFVIYLCRGRPRKQKND